MKPEISTTPANLPLDEDFVPGAAPTEDDRPWPEEGAEPLQQLADLVATGAPIYPAAPRATLPATAGDFLPMPMEATRMIQRVSLVADIIARVMVEGEHYGPAFPGDKKKSLQKPGIDLLCLTFGFRLEPVEMPSTVRTKEFINIAYRVDVVHIATARVVASGLGSANSREEKYRWARGSGKPTCPTCGLDGGVWKSKNQGEGFFCWRQKGGCGATFAQDDRAILDQDVDKKENDNAWDFLNTLEKMAFKRASMAGVITACGVSNKFRAGGDEEAPRGQGRRQEAPAASQARQAPPPAEEPRAARWESPRAAAVQPQASPGGAAAKAAEARARQDAEVALQEVKNRAALCHGPAAFRLLTDELKRRGMFTDPVKAFLAAECERRFPVGPAPDATQAAASA